MSWDVISCRTIERVIRENPDADLHEDLHKYNALTLQGIAMLRFLPEQVRSLEAVLVIKQFAEDKAQRVGSRGAGGGTSSGPTPSLPDKNGG